MNKQYFVYILCSKKNGTLYAGMTGKPLKQRVWEHKQKSVEGFTKKYNIDKLVYFELFDSAYQAITREKQIKAGSRMKKIQLIESINKNWRDLYDEIG